MKIIQSDSHKKLEADLMSHPPLLSEPDNSLKKDKKKRKKYHGFLNQKFNNPDNVSIEDVVE